MTNPNLIAIFLFSKIEFEIKVDAPAWIKFTTCVEEIEPHMIPLFPTQFGGCIANSFSLSHSVSPPCEIGFDGKASHTPSHV